jgi:hypothetical protein
VGNTSSGNQNQGSKGPTNENEAAPQDHEQPAEKYRGLIASRTKLLRREDQDQADDQVNDGKAGK